MAIAVDERQALSAAKSLFVVLVVVAPVLEFFLDAVADLEVVVAGDRHVPGIEQIDESGGFAAALRKTAGDAGVPVGAS